MKTKLFIVAVMWEKSLLHHQYNSVEQKNYQKSTNEISHFPFFPIK